jgi:hypothetical protein
MCAWVRSCPLKAKLPGGAFVARAGADRTGVGLDVRRFSEPAVFQDRQHRHRAAEVVRHEQVPAGGVDVHVRGPGAAGAHRVEELQRAVPPVDGERADAALLVGAHPIGLVGRVEPGPRGVEREAARARAHLDDAAGDIAPLSRSTRKRWMPRPLPGGRSTWVGSVSRSGELNVPT